jgi:hypothetical protein
MPLSVQDTQFLLMMCQASHLALGRNVDPHSDGCANNVNVTRLGRNMQHCLIDMILGVNVCPSAHQQFRHSQMAPIGRAVEHGPPILNKFNQGTSK